MNECKDLLAQGFYAKKQIFLKDALISWSHRRRFETALRLAAELRPRRLLDYGCGDGTFLALFQQTSNSLNEADGCELLQADVLNLKQRFQALPSLRFHTVVELDDSAEDGRYDLITCMEVLEHVVEVQTVIARLQRLLSGEGRLLISVPVEIGVALMVKQTARRIAGWRGLGHYRFVARYKLLELWASLIPGSKQHIPRPIYQDPDGNFFHDHKGFNWRVLRRDLEGVFHMENIVYSPVSWFPALASQVWFVLSRKAIAPSSRP